MFNDWNFLAFSPLFPVATDILAHFKWLDHQGLVGRCFYNYLRAGKRWNLTSVFGISLDDVSKDGENFFLPLFAGAGCTAQLTQLSLALGCSGRSGWSGPEKKVTRIMISKIVKKLWNPPNLMSIVELSNLLFFFLPTQFIAEDFTTAQYTLLLLAEPTGRAARRVMVVYSHKNLLFFEILMKRESWEINWLGRK